ncbi:MAG: alpha/beta hydrolase [Actinomycetota bacterium]|nr:alpha/beta hydrolase [Actinomycetota bacterium]
MRTASDLQYVQHGGFRTAYRKAGDGPPVLLIHGSGPGVSGQANRRGTMSADSPVAAQHRLLAPDVVGFGATTSDPNVPLDHDSRVSQMIGFITGMDLGRVDLVGNSMGGAIALAIAHRRPDLVRRMVLMGTVGISFPITPGLDEVWGYTPSLENMASIVRLFDPR